MAITLPPKRYLNCIVATRKLKGFDTVVHAIVRPETGPRHFTLNELDDLKLQIKANWKYFQDRFPEFKEAEFQIMEVYEDSAMLLNYGSEGLFGTNSI